MTDISFIHDEQRARSGVIAAFMAEESALPAQLAALDEALDGRVSRAIAAADFKGKSGQSLDIPGLDGIDRVFVVGAGKAADLDAPGAEKLGGRMAAALMRARIDQAVVLAAPPDGAPLKAADFAARLASGLYLRNYVFDKYKSDDKKKGAPKAFAAAALLVDAAPAAGAAEKRFTPLRAVADAAHMARDLVNEPSNVLTPKTFAKRLRKLAKMGLKVEVLKPRALKKIGMRALLAVGQGSANRPRVVVLRYQGGDKDAAPVAFVGKGVTFDSGGISIKPSQSMDEMKGDMGGAAAVAGIMRALAARRAKVNAVGVIGLVENMPDGKAQRPGDVVRSLSGQTIAVLNTDAEGRLVLADCLTYAQRQFKPKWLVNLATLTGAIMVALGKEYAGLFANDDALAEDLNAAGAATGEKVWRMPLGAAYDKQIDHEVADMKNIGERWGGSITPAQFLKRFIENGTPWAHLDIAGTAMAAEKSDLNDSWGSGFGVRLLDELVRRREKA
ncbi:MAG TPA: leucyl aminopeptidase [Thermopetrobacter sp.]|nr:leucyl aminopeptidase [Thermopetrobacter sp.]